MFWRTAGVCGILALTSGCMSTAQERHQQARAYAQAQHVQRIQQTHQLQQAQQMAWLSWQNQQLQRQLVGQARDVAAVIAINRALASRVQRLEHRAPDHAARTPHSGKQGSTPAEADEPMLRSAIDPLTGDAELHELVRDVQVLIDAGRVRITRDAQGRLRLTLPRVLDEHDPWTL